MARYRTIETKFWSNNFVQETLRPEERLVYAYLLTNERVPASGIYQVTRRQIFFESGVSNRDVVDSALDKLMSTGRVMYDDDTLWIVNFDKYHLWTSPKVGVCVRKSVETLPDGEVKTLFLEHHRKFFATLIKKLEDQKLKEMIKIKEEKQRLLEEYEERARIENEQAEIDRKLGVLKELEEEKAKSTKKRATKTEKPTKAVTAVKESKPKLTPDDHAYWKAFGEGDGAEIAETFYRKTGISPTRSDFGRWKKDIARFLEAEIIPLYVERAIDKMTADGLTITAPGSVFNIARMMKSRPTVANSAKVQQEPTENDKDKAIRYAKMDAESALVIYGEESPEYREAMEEIKTLENSGFVSPVKVSDFIDCDIVEYDEICY